jgi:cytochrome c553
MVKLLSFVAAFVLLLASPASAQLTDVTQTPNIENEGIHKSLSQQIGAGRGDALTPDSSLYIIRRDPFRSIRRGRQLFQRKFTIAQGAGPRSRDGIHDDINGDPSPGAGLVDSCAGCHGRPRGSAGFGGDVFTRPDSRDAPHLFGLGLVEMLADEMTTDLRAIRANAVRLALQSRRSVSLTLVAKGTRFGRITARADGTLDTSGVQGVDADLRVRPFFHHGGEFSIRGFSVGAFNDEMGLESPDADLIIASAGGRVVTPSGLVLDGSLDRIQVPGVPNETADDDLDGKVNEMPTALIDHMEFYLLNYFKAGKSEQTRAAQTGRAVFSLVGCASCHTPNLTIQSDRRVADLETVFDPQRGHFNRLFATATAFITPVEDVAGLPALKQPQRRSFVVRDIFADFKRHDLGPQFHERNFDGQIRTHFLTEPLWGVGSTAPYGHDGRSINLLEVILRHGGEAKSSRDAFAALPPAVRGTVMDFLNSLVLFPPDDTASNLDPGNPSAAGFPQRGHGSIRLTTLFNDPSDVE